MRKSLNSKGFTLIELLVVISIIALLLAILMPALSMVQRRTRSVVCRAHLHQWGLCYQLYTEDRGGKLPSYIGGTVDVSFMESLRPYFSDVNRLRTCPSATKVSRNNPTTLQPKSFFGSTITAWQIDPIAGWLDNEDWGIGSYTENSWLRSSSLTSPNEKEWGSFARMHRLSEVPLLSDGRWHDSHVENNVPASATTEKDFYNLSNWWTISTFMMRRHKDGINTIRADMSAVPVRTEDLWMYKWHRTFEKVRDVDLPWLKREL